MLTNRPSAPGADHPIRAVEHGGDARLLVDLVEDGDVVLGRCDGVAHVGLLALVGEAGDTTPATHGVVFRIGCARRRESGHADRGRSVLEEPRLGGLELVDLAVVLVQQGACGLYVAATGEPQLELHALVGGKSPQLLDLGGELVGVGLVLRCVGYLALQLLDERLLLGE